jgi:methionyl aminopeptidase
MLEGEIFAIETFPTTGDSIIYESEECNHYMIESKNVKNFYNNKYLSKIFQDRSTLAFCPRWFNFKIPDSNYITKYPVLRTKDKSIVAQYEKTIYIKDNGITILN